MAAQRSASWRLTVTILITVLCVGCSSTPPTPTPTTTTTPEQIILYSWAEYMPQAVLDAFAAEYHINVAVTTYSSQEEAVAAIRAGEVAFDVAVIASDMLPELIREGRLALLQRANMPNLANVSPNFRNLVFDPENKYSVPYLWGTTGLLVRSDLVTTSITSWRDLWDTRYAGKIAARPLATELLTVALKSLEQPFDAEDPAALEMALRRLLLLKPSLRFVDVETNDALAPLLNGEVVLMVGWNGDALTARQTNPAVVYVLPEEGAIAWVDNLVIAADSPHHQACETFINFLHRPAISAEIVEAYYYPSTNEAAYRFVDPDLAADPLVFPSAADIARLDFYAPLSPAGKALYQEIWERFWAAP